MSTSPSAPATKSQTHWAAPRSPTSSPPLWNAVGQDEAEQLQAIGYALGKLPNLDEWPAHPITPYDAAIITAHLQMIPAFYGEFPLKAQARTIHCMLAIAGRLHSCRGHRAKPRLVNCLIEWAHALTS